jgi:hypothetical protein
MADVERRSKPRKIEPKDDKNLYYVVGATVLVAAIFFTWGKLAGRKTT